METRTTEIQNDAIQETISVIKYNAPFLPDSYVNVILARWLRSLRHLNDYFKLIDKDVYFNIYEQYIKAVLHRPTVDIKLAVLSNDHDVVLGWSVLENSALHYIHIQEANRGNKYSTLLIPNDIKSCTHITKHWLEIWPKKYKQVIFNPF